MVVRVGGHWCFEQKRGYLVSRLAPFIFFKNDVLKCVANANHEIPKEERVTVDAKACAHVGAKLEWDVVEVILHTHLWGQSEKEGFVL